MFAIQFIGTQRSGSNLLRVMLNQHPLISAHHPPHLLHTFYPLVHLYGNLEVPENRSNLAADLIQWVKHNPVSWEPFDLSADLLARDNFSLIDMVNFIYAYKAKLDNATIWSCKSTFNVDYLDDIEQKVHPFYVYLYRDGRDVACSFKKAIVGPKHIYAIAKKWKNEQIKSLDFIRKLPANRYISIRYEDFIQNPRFILNQICEKLQISYDERMMQYHLSEESKRTAQSGDMWKNVTKPIIQENKQKYFKELSAEEIEIFESVAGDELKTLGYTCENTSKRHFTKDDIMLFDEDNKLKQKASLDNASKEDKAKRFPQENLLKQISERLLGTLHNAS